MCVGVWVCGCDVNIHCLISLKDHLYGGPVVHFSILVPRFSIFAPQFSLFNFRSWILALRFLLLDSRSSIFTPRMGAVCVKIKLLWNLLKQLTFNDSSGHLVNPNHTSHSTLNILVNPNPTSYSSGGY